MVSLSKTSVKGGGERCYPVASSWLLNYWELTMVRARGQDGGVGRPRAHLIDAKDWNPAEKKSSATTDTEKEAP